MRKEVLYDIFVDIHKAYDTLDRGSSLVILEGCGVGPQVFQLLTRYWYWATIVMRVSGYYRYPFHGSLVVGQVGTTLPPNHQYYSVRNHPPLGWSIVIEQVRS